MSRATGFSGWSRPGTTGAWGMSNFAPYSRDQEVDTLKDQAELLNKELEAINSRIREMESAGQ